MFPRTTWERITLTLCVAIAEDGVTFQTSHQEAERSPLIRRAERPTEAAPRGATGKPAMLRKLGNWLDDRTGYRRLIEALLIEHIPGGAKWRYVWGSTLAFVFTVQLITGILLMTAYSPGDSTAWGSVYFIQYQMDFGWLIRGLHHFGSQTMVVLLGIHMLQVVIAGAHLPPREVNWWLGLGLLGTVLGLSLTGYLLPWDQKGYWATQVATNIAGSLPGLGSWLQKIIVGGPKYGHHTLTHFFTLHVGILPLLTIVLIIAHLTVFRRHGITTPKNAEGEGWFWPDQAFRDMVASMLIFGVMIGLVLYGHGQKVDTPAERSFYDQIAHAGGDGKGANLDAPADPAKPYPARPEWYFLFLFQLLKYFPGEQEVVGTVVIPNAALVVLAILPLLGYGRFRRFGHIVGVLVIVGLLTGAAALTMLAIAEDMVYPLGRALVNRLGRELIPLTAGIFLVLLAWLAVLPRSSFRKFVAIIGCVVILALLGSAGSLLYLAKADDDQYWRARREGKQLAEGCVPKAVASWVKSRMTPNEKIEPRRESAKNKDEGEESPMQAAAKFRDQQLEADASAARAIKLAGAGIPDGGAVYLLRRDPMTAGKELFKQHCAVCHTHGDDFKVENPTASDLAGFGTEEWIYRLITNPGHEDFFGRPKFTIMAEFIEESFPNVAIPADQEAKLRAEEKETLDKDRADLRVIAQWLAKHPRKTSDDRDTEPFQKGLQTFKGRQCNGCHSYEGQGGSRSKRGPDFTGYGDAEWVRLMMMGPDHPLRYGKKNQMPAFRDFAAPGGEVALLEFKEQHPTAKRVQLSDVDRELIIRYILNDDRVVFGGTPISGPPIKKD